MPKNVNKTGNAQWIQSEVQTIAGEIAHSPISQKKYQNLSKKLDKAFVSLQDLETKDKMESLFLQAQRGQLKEQMVKLYGDLESGLVKREVTQIQQESTSLRQGRLTSKAVKKLESHIAELEKNYLTSVPDRRILADARQALVEAKAKLAGRPLVNHFDLMASQKNVRFVEEVELLPGDIEELFDIARAVYNNDFRQAKMRFAGLPEEHRRRFDRHMQQLMGRPFVSTLETMQALIATANDLVENAEKYPTREAIDQLFMGLSQLDGEERTGGKIFSFPT